MNHGDYILDLLRNHPGSGRTVLLIRHSVRDSLRCVPAGLRDDVPITPEGVVHAVEFGRKLKTIAPDTIVHLGHTAPRRCRMTAEAICTGYSSPDNTRDLGVVPDVNSVIVDPGAFSALWEEMGWHTLIRQWLSGNISEDTVHNPHWYTDQLLRNLAAFPAGDDSDLLVIVAHDVTIMPIVASVMGTLLTSIDFLNGVVISGDGSGAGIWYADSIHRLSGEWSRE